MKTWTYRNRRYTMEKKMTGYGQYSLNGYHCTDSTIWDNCDNDENPQKMREARMAAEWFVSYKKTEY